MPRTIVITGGGTGIGRAAAARFAADGDRVTILGRRGDVLAKTADELGVTALTCDVSDPDALTGALADLPVDIDVLVNNAGGNTDFDNPDAHDLRQLAANWRANLCSNVLTAVLTTTALRDRLRAGGAVIGVGSIAAEKGAGAYGAAKAALAAWNIDLAGTLGPRDITANVVSCGYIADTEFFRDFLTDERRGTLVAQTAVRRAGDPADVAGVIAFLASADARHLTGQVLNVNGGAWTTR
ncbi:MAG: SDR family oxidoreductase [Actinocatenispora sp.]